MDEEQLPSEYYKEGLSDRKEYETRAENLASISLPYLIRTEGSSASTQMGSSAGQSFNGMLLNNLKAKMGMSLLPPTTSSFKLSPDPLALKEMYGDDDSMLSDINQELSMVTDVINKEIEAQQIRSSLFDVLLQMIAVGSVIVEKVKGEGIQMHTLKSFVVSLDSRGNPYKMCIVETLHELPEGITPKEEKDEYDLYIMLSYDVKSKKWIRKQEVDGEIVGQEASWSKEDMPYKYLGWTWMQWDSYHRPFAEDYVGDMEQVNVLSKLNTSGAVSSAKQIIFVDPRGGRTRLEDVAKSSNGDIVNGRADDVTAFQLNKNHDFAVTQAREEAIMRNLQKQFLDNGSVTRDAERVTAAEIRIMAQQLESSSLAGIYSKMSLQWSKWLIHMVMKELSIKIESVETEILTGLDALGRPQDSQRLDALVTRMVQMELGSYIKESELINRYASYENVNTVGLIKTADEVAQERQQAQEQAQQAQMRQEGGNALAQEAGRAAIQSAGVQPNQ